MFWQGRKYYKSLSRDDELQNFGEKAGLSPKPSYRKHIILAGSFSLLALLILLLVSVTHRSRHPLWSSCGDTPATARSRNCSFDIISFAWQTPECYDSTLVDEFIASESWQYYVDPSLDRPEPQEVAVRGEQNLFASWHFHVVHCAFTWRQMHRSFERGWIDSHLKAFNNTLHCQNVLLGKEFTGPGQVTHAKVIYPVCERTGSDIKSASGWWDHVYSRQRFHDNSRF